jgi:nitroreductase
MRTCIAMRHLKTDEVPEDIIKKVIQAATYASNPGNSQNWKFVVVRDRARKERMATAVQAMLGSHFSGGPTGDASRDKMMVLDDWLRALPMYPCGFLWSGSINTRRKHRTKTSCGRRSTRLRRTWCWPLDRSGSERRSQLSTMWLNRSSEKSWACLMMPIWAQLLRWAIPKKSLPV